LLKRGFDILFSLVGIIIFSPLFVVIGILIKIDSTGTVFFRQERIGKDFRPFKILKFRTMTVDVHENAPLITVSGDKRVTRIGKFLRKTKIDELPQLINVLKGEMSFVGPRPEVPMYVEMFRDDYKEILTVRPGITDYATVEFRDEEGVLKKYGNTEIGYINEVLPRKIELYKKYLKEKCLITDLKLIFLTLFRIVKQ